MASSSKSLQSGSTQQQQAARALAELQAELDRQALLARQLEVRKVQLEGQLAEREREHSRQGSAQRAAVEELERELAAKATAAQELHAGHCRGMEDKLHELRGLKRERGQLLMDKQELQVTLDGSKSSYSLLLAKAEALEAALAEAQSAALAQQRQAQEQADRQLLSNQDELSETLSSMRAQSQAALAELNEFHHAKSEELNARLRELAVARSRLEAEVQHAGMERARLEREAAAAAEDAARLDKARQTLVETQQQLDASGEEKQAMAEEREGARRANQQLQQQAGELREDQQQQREIIADLQASARQQVIIIII